MVDVLVRGAAVLLDRGVQAGEFLADDLPDVVVATGGIGLELDAEEVAVVEQAHVRGAHQVEDRARLVVGRPAVGGFVEHESCPLEAVTDRGEEQLALGPEQLEQVRLRDADRPGDRFGRGAGIPALGELVEGRHDDRVAPFVGGLAGGGGCVHGDNLVSTK